MGHSIVKGLGAAVTRRMKAAAPKWTVKTLAAASGISTGTIDRATRGDVAISVDKLAGLAKGLGLKSWELVREAEEGLRGAAEKAPLNGDRDDVLRPLRPAHRELERAVNKLLGTLTDAQANTVTSSIYRFAGENLAAEETEAQVLAKRKE